MKNNIGIMIYCFLDVTQYICLIILLLNLRDLLKYQKYTWIILNVPFYKYYYSFGEKLSPKKKIYPKMFFSIHNLMKKKFSFVFVSLLL